MIGRQRIPLGIRLRRFLGASPVLVITALVILAGAGAYATYAVYVDPPTQERTEVVPLWTASGSFTHQASVTKSTDLYPAGTILESRPYYFSSVTPLLDGSFSFAYEAEAGDLRVETTPVLVIRAVDSRQETVYWHTSESLGDTHAPTVDPNEVVTVPFTVDVAAVNERISRIQEQLGASRGNVEAEVLVRVAVAGNVDGTTVDETLEYVLPITIDGAGYAVGATDPSVETFTEVATAEVPYTPGIGRLGAGPVLLGSAVFVGVGYLFARKRGSLDVSASDVDRARFTRARQSYDEWVGTVELPDTALGNLSVRVADFESLVDIAIGAGTVVLEDTTQGTYTVLHGDVRYTYSPPPDEDTMTSDTDAAWTDLTLGSAGVDPDVDDVSVTDGGADE